jgi:hypothetical protein
MSRQSFYNSKHAARSGIEAHEIGARSWGNFAAIKTWQKENAHHGDPPLVADGWFGPRSVEAFARAVADASPGAPGKQARPAIPNAIPIFGQRMEIPGLMQPLIYRPHTLGGRERPRGTVVNSAILHQSVTNTVDRCERVLQRRGLGVDFAIDHDGTVICYRDIGTHYSAHGNERNRTSVGIEVINPYYPSAARDHWKDEPIVASRTAHKGREILDTDAQLAALAALVRFLASLDLDGPGGRSIGIPLMFPTTKPGKTSRGHSSWWNNKIGGIIAHGHRPGRYPAGHRKAGKPSGGHADARRTVVRLLDRIHPIAVS